ncbi:MAG TPA: hypothetical protein VNU46_07495 [Gemmatimonadaceae bacterium]|jgi:hypothetical protein|nr:hypothetical protein [Gemmatimonadaceae bacterium]
MLFTLTRLVLSATLAAAHGPAPTAALRADTIVASDTTQPILPDSAIHQMLVFWANFQHEPAAVRDSANAATHEEIVFHLAGQLDTLPERRKLFDYPRGVNVLVLAQRYPSVVADLHRANLTPLQWEQFRRSLYAAFVLDQLMKDGLPKSKVEGLVSVTTLRNVEVLHAHAKDVDALVAAGMTFPPVAQGKFVDPNAPANLDP